MVSCAAAFMQDDAAACDQASSAAAGALCHSTKAAMQSLASSGVVTRDVAAQLDQHAADVRAKLLQRVQVRGEHMHEGTVHFTRLAAL